MSTTTIPNTNITLTKCPPAIAKGATVAWQVRKQVAAQRRQWFKENSANCCVGPIS